MPLSLHTMADSTNVDDKVRIGSSFHCIGKATAVGAHDILASRGIINLRENSQCHNYKDNNRLTVNFVLLVKAALTVTMYFGPGL